MDLNFIRQNIKNLRKLGGITQRDMANRLFMDERTYSKVERGEKKSMDITLLASIADILNTDVPTLIKNPVPAPDEDMNLLPVSVTVKEAALSSREYYEIMDEIRQLKREIKELILCHREAIDTIKMTS